MRRRIAPFLAALALLLACAGCGSQAERNAVRSDIHRFREARAVEYEQAKRDFARYAKDNILRAKELPIDVEHYLEWRHREWWNLTDELAVASAYEWEQVERISVGVARFYGYEVRNFPRLPEDIARFFERADPEWRGLVQDVIIYLEWRDREFLPLRKDISEALAKVSWESGNLAVDVIEFVQWRDREWRKLRSDTDHLLFAERQLGGELRTDFRRFRAARAAEAKRLPADLSAWWNYEVQAMPPRLLDDSWRWAVQSPRELDQLARDIEDFGKGLGTDTFALLDEIERLHHDTLEQVPYLIADIDRFFDTYEHEWGPLQAGIRRWWTVNVALGIVARADMRSFFIDHAGEETAELQAGMRRFVSYGRKEWGDFKRALARFFSNDEGRAFGATQSGPGASGAGVFDDPRAYPARSD